jgi:hypothetical protein
MSGEAIALVTANFGGIDGMKPISKTNPRVQGFYYTDQATASTASEKAKEGWGHIIVPDYPRHDFNDRLRARYFKHQIHRLDEVQRYRWLAWVDSSVWIKDADFLAGWADVLDGLPPQHRCMVIPHNARSTVQQEFEFIQGEIDKGETYQIVRYGNEKMKEQMNWFKKMGLDTNAPLFVGTIWMVENSPLMQEALNTWWDQNLRFGMMDQLSFSLVFDHYGIIPSQFNVEVWDTRYWVVAMHKSKDK